MSKYTVELRKILNNNIFDFSYSFIDDIMKEKLEQMFISHFYFREIGFETIAKFKHYLKMTFIEKLEYYEMLVKTAQIEYDILNNYDLKENYTKSTQSTSTSDNSINNIENVTENTSYKENIKNSNTSTGNNTNSSTVTDLTKFSDTPQSSVSLNDGYLTNVTDKNNTTSDTGNFSNSESGTNEASSTNTNTKENINNTTGKNLNEGSQEETYTLTRKGNIGVMTSTDMLEKHIEYQKKVTNIINMFLVNECSNLFMMIY